MPFLTIFTTPKPFTINPHINMIQRNAIQSWLHLGPEVEVFLVGNEAGMAEVASEFGIPHFPDVGCNEQGTPLLSSMYDLARQASRAQLLAHLNADILVMPDFVTAARCVSDQADLFLAAGQRWDLDVSKPLDFSSGWDARLQTEVVSRGRLHPPVGSDYYIFPRPLLADMPDFAIGRSGWDNWTIYHALQSGWSVVDITPDATVVHQNHDYSHLPGGLPPYDLEETKRNIALAGGMKHMYTMLEANKRLVNGKIRPARMSLPGFWHRLELLVTSDDLQGARKTIVQQLRRLRRKYERMA
jgi:hypothetical protein